VGPYTKINGQIIPSSNDSLVGDDYTYEDKPVQAGRTYFYKLEDIEFNGAKNQHGPVSQKAENHASIFLLLGGILFSTAILCVWGQIRKSNNIKTLKI
jgi:hypothetical protein